MCEYQDINIKYAGSVPAFLVSFGTIFFVIEKHVFGMSSGM